MTPEQIKAEADKIVEMYRPHAYISIDGDMNIEKMHATDCAILHVQGLINNLPNGCLECKGMTPLEYEELNLILTELKSRV